MSGAKRIKETPPFGGVGPRILSMVLFLDTNLTK